MPDQNLKKLPTGWEARFKLHGREHRRKFRTRVLAESWLVSSRLRLETLGRGNAISGGRWAKIMTALELLAPGQGVDAGIQALIPAVRFFMRHRHPEQVVPILQDGVEDLISTWRQERKNKRYIGNAGSILRRFAGSFSNRLPSTISASEVHQWVLLQSPGARTSSKARVSALFSHCILRGWCATNPCKGFLAPRRPRSPVKVPSPPEISHFLQMVCANPESKVLAAYFCIRLFAGLRASEAALLEWGHIDFQATIISVPHGLAAKHGPARRVPLASNLAAWLLWLMPSTPPLTIAPISVIRLERIFRKKNGFNGPLWANALRHGFGSYRSPQLASLDELALEMGNSRRVLVDHYVGAVPADSVQNFWEISPEILKTC